MNKNKSTGSVFVPLGIAFALLACAFTLEAGAAQWMWSSEPGLGVLFAAVGLAFLTAHFIRRHRRTQR